MKQPLAKQGDTVVAVDTHIVMVPSPSGTVPTPLPHPFNGIINGNLSPNVFVGGRPAATVGSTANNTPPHIPTPPGTAFQIPPTNQANILIGSATVKINGRMAARNNDTAQTCADPVPNTSGKVIAAGNVMVGD